MKKIVLGLLLAVQLSSCATMMSYDVPLTKHQQMPLDGSHRKLSGWFYADLLFPPSLIVDFWTAKIYREYPKGSPPEMIYPNYIPKTVTDREPFVKINHKND